MTNPARVVLTTARIEAIALPIAGRIELSDAKVEGLRLRVTSAGVRSWALLKRVDGKLQRLTIGRYPAVGPAAAREAATRLLGDIAKGQNPAAERAKRRAAALTLGQAFDAYMQAKGPRLRPRTAASYHDAFRLTLSGWRDKPLREIRRADVEQLHRQRSKETKAGADGAMRVLSAVMNFAADMVADSGEPLDNPVRRLSAQSLWNKPPRRTAIIPFDKLPAWIAAVRADPSPVQSAYLLTLLGTGLRRREACRLLWTDIDLSATTVTLRPEETKSGRGTTLPLPSQVVALLKALPQAGPWAFPDANGNPIADARTALERACKATGIAITHHDLRRTYATAADAVGLGSYTIKRLVNHAAQGGGQDVTAGYVQAESGTLAAASQRIADYLFQ